MTMHPFFTFEGPEGSGKTTQMALLQQALQKAGHDVVAVREPGGTPLGEDIRGLLLNQASDMSPRTETLLFNAARAQLVADVIGPALQAGRIVLCDRFTDSTLAYQGYGRQQELAQLRPLIAYATGGLEPALRIYLDLSPAEGLQRIRRRSAAASRREWNRLDAQELAFHQAVQAGYQTLIQDNAQGWLQVDARQAPDSIHRQISRTIREILALQTEKGP